MKNNSTVLDVTSVCLSFPEMPEPNIERAHILNTLEESFSTNTDFIMLEGEGVGKTNLLAQFAIKHDSEVICFFIKPNSRLSYDPDILTFDIANQLGWLLRSQEIASDEKVDIAIVQRRLMELCRKRARIKKPFYFVIDGLNHLPQEDDSILRVILDLLPLGYSGFKFLFSGETKNLKNELKSYYVKSVLIPTFTIDEASRYLAGFDINRQQIDEIYLTCQGKPVHLATIRRILLTGTDTSTLLSNLSNKLPELFEIEWANVAKGDEIQEKLLGILAYDRRKHSVNTLAQTIQVTELAVKEKLSKLGFITIHQDSKEVKFVSEAFQKFAAEQLNQSKQRFLDLIINRLRNEPSSDDALIHLPSYLEEANRLEEIFHHLSPDNIATLVERNQSLTIVQQQVDLGLNSALRLERDADLVRFSMQKSALQDLYTAEAWRSEVTARMALKDYDSALSLAQNSILRVDRLHLLATIAKSKKKQGIPLDKDILEKIKYLYNQIDISNLGERANEIAFDLLYTHPELAIELVEKANSSGTGEQNIDWALLRLSMTSWIEEEESDLVNISEGDSNIFFKNPIVNKFTNEISILIRDYNASKVISEIKNVETPKNAIYLLRKWLIINQEHIEADQVIDFALKYIIQTTSYAPNARDLREIAAPLPFVENMENSKKFIEILDTQMSIIIDRGPTEDNIRLQLLIAESEAKYNAPGCYSRFESIYRTVINVNDPATRSECLAYFVATLNNINQLNRLKHHNILYSNVEQQLKLSIEQLLLSTADHYTMTRGVINALARSDFYLAFDFANKLNVITRREAALLDLIEAAIDVPDDQIQFELLQIALHEISDPLHIDQAMTKIIERLSYINNKIENNLNYALKFIQNIPIITDIGKRCYVLCLAHKFLFHQDEQKFSSYRKELTDRLMEDWNSIDVCWHKVELGFKIASKLAKNTPEIAKEYLDKSEKLREEISLDTQSIADSYLNCMRLAIRAYSGLLLKHLDNENDISILQELIEQIPSDGEQALLWGDLAIYYAIYNRMNDCSTIVNQRIKPLLENIPSQDKRYRSFVISRLAPALYVAHSRTALDKIESILPLYQEQAYQSICFYILRKQIPTDPYDYFPGRGFETNYNDLFEICELISSLKVDAIVFNLIKIVVDAIDRRNNHLSQQQKASLIAKLDTVISTKLPSPNYIQHLGYKIASQAQLERLRPYKLEAWNKLIQDAYKITNTSDRALVLCIIASTIPSKGSQRSIEVLEEARIITDQITVAADRFDRYEVLARYAMDIDILLGRKYLKLAMQETLHNNTPDKQTNQRRIIDLAYRLDPDFAATLSSSIDNDPARRNIDRHIHILEMKKALTGKDHLNEQSLKNFEDYANLAWRLLGALNADRINTIHVDRTRKFVSAAANLPLNKSYFIHSWIIQNAIRRFSNTPQATAYLRPIFDATITASRLTQRMAQKTSSQIKDKKVQLEKQKNNAVHLFKAGQREKVLDFLRDWFEHEVNGYLKICDQFFGPEDLELLKLLKSVKPTCKVSILTSKKHHDSYGDPVSAYHNNWKTLSDEDPPETEILIVNMPPNGNSPIHDRWWFTSSSGLAVGTSFNSLGITQDSTITRLSLTELDMLEQDADQYFNRKREVKGVRLIYNLITL